ncbi:MAG TPA: DUF5671 domain-containing protein [Candidatus Paceibacterota bacterium]|nr:DUF5671 domain-containing protein [Candidatus Paceibacterota bacterium]
MQTPKATPKDFFLWAGAMLMLYGSAIAFIRLLIDYINYAFPDALSYYTWDPYQGSVSFEIASLIVLFPAFLILMRAIRRDIAEDPSRSDVWVRRWALYLTVFIAGLTIAGDLITFIYYFLSGQDITVRFILKVLVVLLVAGGGFMHFLADIWGFWVKYPARARSVGWSVLVLIVLSIAAGFFIIGTPWEARVMRLDNQRVQDLQNIQSQVLSFYQQKQMLPSVLAQLEDPTLYFDIPKDPETGMEYEYIKDADLGFELCATFAAPNKENTVATGISARPTAAPRAYGVVGDADWDHGAGRTCFVRSIDPDFFPPFNKAAQ